MRTLESKFRNEYGNDMKAEVIATDDAVRTFLKGPNNDTTIELTPVECIEVARLWGEAGVVASVRQYRRALFMCAAHCQGGSSTAGMIAAELLGVPFPCRMEELEAKAAREGFDVDDLWPWLSGMRAAARRA